MRKVKGYQFKMGFCKGDTVPFDPLVFYNFSFRKIENKDRDLPV